MLADYINQSDTAAMLDPYLLAADTNSLSDRIDEKLNISDTASMLRCWRTTSISRTRRLCWIHTCWQQIRTR
jgi:hypothetical protein